MLYDSVEDLLERVPSGWREIAREAAQKIVDDKIEVFDIKEKFGTLRVYTGWSSSGFLDMLDRLEDKSEEVCMRCGAPGELRNLPWMLTLCSKHYDEELVNQLGKKP